MSSSSHIPSSTRKVAAMLSYRRKSRQDPRNLQAFSSERDRIFAKHREDRDFFFELQADHAAQGEKADLSELSEVEYL